MKFVHVADLHIGKSIKNYNLIEIQRDLLNQLLDYMSNNNLKVLVIAGDVYDHSNPSNEAINVLDAFLDEAINNRHFTILMISGNHDSSDRLNFASSLLKKQGLYIETQVHEEFKPIVIDDVNFYLLPFFKPSKIRMMYKLDNINSYQEAFEEYFKHQNIDTTKKNVLVTHQFVGKNSITSDSEMILTVGGSEIIDASLFNDFNYVALGHLHASQKVSRETIRYSGSLMKYSFDEVKQEKTICIVDTNDFSLDFHSLKPIKDLDIYEGYYKDLLNDKSLNKDNLLQINILDDKVIPHAIDNLRNIYPNILNISYPNIIYNFNNNRNNIETIERKSTIELYKSFYKYMTGNDIDNESLKIITDLEEQVNENN